MTQTIAPAGKQRSGDELAIVDPRRCVGCSYCRLSCPFDVIDLVNGLAVIRLECTACWVCLRYCPVDAIHKGSRAPSTTATNARRAAS